MFDGKANRISNCFNSRAMARNSEFPLFFCPTSVAIHNDGNMPGTVRR